VFLLNLQQSLLGAWAQIWNSLVLFIPSIIGAILVFAFGLILAYWIKRFVLDILKLLSVDKFSKSLGFEVFLRKIELKESLSELISIALQWLVILISFLTAVDILGLNVVSQVLGRLISYIPNIFASVLIFAAGYFVAQLVEGLVKGALLSVDHKAAKPVSKFSRWLVIVISFFAAVDQLQIAQGLVTTFFQGLTYTIVLIVGLSVGLGAKDLVARILNEWYDKVKK